MYDERAYVFWLISAAHFLSPTLYTATLAINASTTKNSKRIIIIQIVNQLDPVVFCEAKPHTSAHASLQVPKMCGGAASMQYSMPIYTLILVVSLAIDKPFISANL